MMVNSSARTIALLHLLDSRPETLVPGSRETRTRHVQRAGLVRFAIENLRSQVRVRVQATAPYLIRTFGMDSLSRAI